MKYDNLVYDLFVRFPTLKSIYESEGDYVKDLPHLCFEIVFVPFIRQTVLESDESMIKSICDFMEYMATAEEEPVSELLAVSVLESILSERKVISSLKPYLKTNTLEILSIMEKEYGWN